MEQTRYDGRSFTFQIDRYHLCPEHVRRTHRVVDRLCVGFGAGRLDCIFRKSNLPSCLSLQRLAISVQMIAVQTLERPMRAISSNTEPRLKVCSATAARRAERRSPNTPGRFSTGLHTGAEEIIETLALIAEGSRVASLSRVKDRGGDDPQLASAGSRACHRN